MVKALAKISVAMTSYPMKIALLFLLAFSAPLVRAQEETPKQRLASFLAAGSEADALFAQASKDGVDYRKLLVGARNKEGPALSGIFQYAGSGKIKSEGAEVNGEILYQLLRLWGDQSYAFVLRGEPPRAQAAVLESIRFVWPEDESPAARYPQTFGLTSKK